jgi:hypothetical protein
LSVFGPIRFCIGSELSPEQGEAGDKIGRPFSGHLNGDIPYICAHRPGSSGAGGLCVVGTSNSSVRKRGMKCVCRFASRLQAIAIQLEEMKGLLT